MIFGEFVSFEQGQNKWAKDFSDNQFIYRGTDFSFINLECVYLCVPYIFREDFY